MTKHSPEFRILSQTIVYSFKVILHNFQDHHDKSFLLLTKLGLTLWLMQRFLSTTLRLQENTGSVSPWFIAGEKGQVNLSNGELKMSAKRKIMDCYRLKYLELDQHFWSGFLSKEFTLGKFFILKQNYNVKTSWILSDLSFHRAKPLNLVGAEPLKWNPVVPRREALQWHWQSLLMTENHYFQYSSKCMHSMRLCCSKLC